MPLIIVQLVGTQGTAKYGPISFNFNPLQLHEKDTMEALNKYWNSCIKGLQTYIWEKNINLARSILKYLAKKSIHIQKKKLHPIKKRSKAFNNSQIKKKIPLNLSNKKEKIISPIKNPFKK